MGNDPDVRPQYAPLLAEAWASNLDSGYLAMADERARMRHSDAGKCARQLGYKLAGYEEDKPMDLAGRWVTGLGSIVHDLWQKRITDAWPQAEIEKKVFIEECKSAGHIDALLDKVALELKTINGFGFKVSIGGNKGPAEGPRTSAIMQCALNGYAAEAEKIVIVYLAMENCSDYVIQKIYEGYEPWQKFCAEWSYDRDTFVPLAEAEIKRFAKIQEVVDEGMLPPRAVPLEMPKGARIQDPNTGAWTLASEDGGIIDTGRYWGCNYCPYQPTCAKDS
jgi:hypothetical protein